jgi:hypothetical protein
MKKQTKGLIEIGVLYLGVSIVLDYFLGAYQILLWLALAFEFIIFGLMIMSTLFESLAPTTRKREVDNLPSEDEFKRLGRLCKFAVDQGDQTAGKTLSEKIRSLAFAAAANDLNTSEAALREATEKEPGMLQMKVGDPELFTALTTTGNMVARGDTKILEGLLGKVEEWTT